MSMRNYVVDAALSLGASVDSTPVSVDKNPRGFALAAVITSASSLNGVLKLQGSIDVGSSPSNWGDIPNSSQSVSDNGTTIWNCDTQNYRWVKVSYARTGGSASMAVTFNENF